MIFDLVNTPNNIIHSVGMVMCLHCSLRQALCSFSTIVHRPSHTVRNLLPAQALNFAVMGHSGKDMTSTKVVMVGLKCSALRRFQDKWWPLRLHSDCHQAHWDTIPKICRPHRTPIFHLNLLLIHLGDPPFASKWHYYHCELNNGMLMFDALRMCPKCQRYSTTNLRLITRKMICSTWAVMKANHQSACSKPHSSWSNMPLWWGRQTTAHSTSGRLHGWLRFARISIAPVLWTRTAKHIFQMNRCTQCYHFQMYWWHIRTTYCYNIVLMLNVFGCSTLRSCRKHVPVNSSGNGNAKPR